MSRLRLPLQLAQARLAREGLCPPPRPLALTISVTERCNARCLTCGIPQLREGQQHELELSPADYARILRDIGQLQWLTITGGEPSLRLDITELLTTLVRQTRPRAITIATNGLLGERVVQMVQAVLEVHHHPLIVNLSLDALGPEHDRLRGVTGAWEQTTGTFRQLAQLRGFYPQLVLGIHTVISRHNVAAYPAICDGLLALGPNSLIAEVAQPRAELGNLDQQLAPSAAAYRRAMDHLRRRSAAQASCATGPARHTTWLIQAMRAHYYDAVARYLERPEQLWPCLAGILSGHLSASGRLWGCGVRCEELGDLRLPSADFTQIWQGAAARRFRARVRQERCHCTLANAAYLSMLASPAALGRVATLQLARSLCIAHRR